MFYKIHHVQYRQTNEDGLEWSAENCRKCKVKISCKFRILEKNNTTSFLTLKQKDADENAWETVISWQVTAKKS